LLVALTAKSINVQGYSFCAADSGVFIDVAQSQRLLPLHNSTQFYCGAQQ
jgi:hypothetical protein